MPHGPLSNLIQWQIKNFSAIGRKTLQFASLNFDVSFQEIFSTLCSGGNLVLISEQNRMDLHELLEWCQSQEIERIFVPFIALEHLSREGSSGRRAGEHAMKEVITAGERLQITPAVKEMFAAKNGATLVNQYGPSETHVVTWYVLQGATANWPALPPIGKPIANVRVYVLDRQMRPLPLRVAGDLYLGGPCLARGYLNCPDLTAERFLPDPYSTTGGERLYWTGDRARWTEAGDLEFLGRLDDQIKLRGYRIELGEIEAVLRAHPRVRDAAVLVHEDRPGHKALAAYIVYQPPTEAAIDDLRNYLKERLPEHMIPGIYVELKELPITPSGKVDRRALPNPDGSAESRRTYVAPRTLAEQLLCDICARLLQVEKVGCNDNFFELGGDSLLCLQFVARAKAAGLLISVQQIFLHQTIATLAHHAQHKELARIARRYEGAWAPLSYAQEGLWLLYRLEPGNPFYNIGAAIRLRGRLNVSALEESLNEVIKRHSIFRTAFKESNGRPLQKVMAWSRLALSPTQLPALATESPDSLANAIIEVSRAELARPFALEEGKPVGAVLFTVGADEHVLVLRMHHIVTDEWSINLVMREIGILYEAFNRNSRPSLPSIPIEYADFAIHQREAMATPSFEERLSSWSQKLLGSANLELPTDYVRPGALSYRGATVPFKIDGALYGKLRRFGRDADATMHMVLLTAFVLLLNRYCGQTDIMIGIPVSGRSREELEGVAGLFVNTVVVRIDVSGDPTYSELLRRVRQATVEALAHEDIPFEKVVEALHLDRVMAQSPLFQVMFSMHSSQSESIAFPGLDVEYLPVDMGTSKFDLTMELVETGESVQGALEYSSDLFHRSSAAQIAAHYLAVLERGTARPDDNISRIVLESDHTKILAHALNEEAKFDFTLWPAGN